MENNKKVMLKILALELISIHSIMMLCGWVLTTYGGLKMSFAVPIYILIAIFHFCSLFIVEQVEDYEKEM